MKRIFSMLILIAGSVALAGEAGSQEPDLTPSETTTDGRSANNILNVLAKHLSLTEDQKSKIFADHHRTTTQNPRSVDFVDAVRTTKTGPSARHQRRQR
jgi:hypothetical protein